MKKLPEDYIEASPMDSVFQKSECETIFSNIVHILSRTGNEWRELSWKEYKTERLKDGNFSAVEKQYFDQVIVYAHSERIFLFAKGYKKVYDSK